MIRSLVVALTLTMAALAADIQVGRDAPSGSLCTSQTVGSVYVRSQDSSNGPIQVMRCTQVGSLTFAWHPVSHVVAAALPTTCAVGDLGYKTASVAGLYICSSANTWTKLATGASIASTSNVLSGDGAGGAASSGIAVATVVKGAASLSTAGRVASVASAGTLTDSGIATTTVVLGAAGLTNAGAIPKVSSAGTLAESALTETGTAYWRKYTVTKIANDGDACASATVGSVVFTGTGLNDAASGGTYTSGSTADYTIIIDSAGETDTFKWRRGTGTWTEGVAITGSAQVLGEGITITFTATTGHTATDQWVITATAIGCFQVNSGTPVAVEDDLSQDIVLAELPASAVVERGRIKSATAFSGTTTATSTVGTATTADLYLATGSAYDLKAAVSATNFAEFQPAAGSTTTAAVNLVLNVTTTEENLPLIATGASVDVWLKWSVLP